MEFAYEPTIQLGPDTTEYRLVTKDGIREVEFDGQKYLKVDRDVLKQLAKEAFSEINFYFRKKHLQKLRAELDDPEASDNDKFVIYTHLQNAVVSAAGLLPSCQDTGTAIAFGKKGQFVLTNFDEEEAISEGVFETYQEKNLQRISNQ